MPADSGPLARLIAGMGRSRIELAYPGAWLRPGVYATHGHYLDRHLTVPTFERLAVAAVERVLGGPREVSEEPGSPDDAGSASIEDYERIQAPVYAFLFTLAQAGSAGGRLAGASPSARIWQAVGRRLRPRCQASRLAAGHGRPARARWASPTGSAWGRSGPTSPPARSPAPGLAAIGEVTRRLGIDADHLIFGHTHRRGPMRAESGWRLPEGTRLWNTGSWVYAPGLLGRRPRTAPTGRGPSPCSRTTAPPELRHLLDDRRPARTRRWTAALAFGEAKRSLR